MFSGIVAAVGRIVSSTPMGDGVRVRIESGRLSLDNVKVGDSIAVQGVCLTVVALDAKGFDADISKATLDVTHGLGAGRDVNLEKSLRLGDSLDGHLVSGHVDGVGWLRSIRVDGDARWLTIEFPASLAPFIVRKGSIAVDGISLTVADLRDQELDVMIIPFTWEHTNLSSVTAGERVNLECDMVGKYVARAVELTRRGPG